MNESAVVTLILSLISGFGLLSIVMSFFEKDFEDIRYVEDESLNNGRSICNELDISTYDFYTDEI